MEQLSIDVLGCIFDFLTMPELHSSVCCLNRSIRRLLLTTSELWDDRTLIIRDRASIYQQGGSLISRLYCAWSGIQNLSLNNLNFSCVMKDQKLILPRLSSFTVIQHSSDPSIAHAWFIKLQSKTRFSFFHRHRSTLTAIHIINQAQVCSQCKYEGMHYGKSNYLLVKILETIPTLQEISLDGVDLQVESSTVYQNGSSLKRLNYINIYEPTSEQDELDRLPYLEAHKFPNLIDLIIDHDEIESYDMTDQEVLPHLLSLTLVCSGSVGLMSWASSSSQIPVLMMPRLEHFQIKCIPYCHNHSRRKQTNHLHEFHTDVIAESYLRTYFPRLKTVSVDASLDRRVGNLADLLELEDGPNITYHFTNFVFWTSLTMPNFYTVKNLRNIHLGHDCSFSARMKLYHPKVIDIIRK